MQAKHKVCFQMYTDYNKITLGYLLFLVRPEELIEIW